ncbi:F-box/WD repeat-containing protein 7-like [Oscarella lobularis]|uniref:F-box/WD repeat-containing protein 7-like n=1 Tax=Oscarella lobularis TaxID=121494 RepID=UPI00331313CF
MDNPALQQIVATFSSLPIQQQNNFLKEILKLCQPLQLRIVYAELQPLLAVDFARYLSNDLAERIFSWLDVQSLCRASQCSRSWRDRADADHLWRRHCRRRGWLRFGSISSSVTRWKDVYVRALRLEANWARGRYVVEPILRGHKKRIGCIDCDGRILVSGSADNTARIWDLEGHKCIRVLDSHSDEVTCIALRNGILVTGCSDGLIRLWNAESGKRLGQFTGDPGGAGICSMAFDGQTLICGTADRGRLQVWSAVEGRHLDTLMGHADEVKCIQLAGSVAISGSWDRTLRVWDLKKGISKHILKRHTEGIFCCQADEEKAVSGGGDGLVVLWDLQKGDALHAMMGHEAEVYCLEYNADVIATGSADSTARLWDHNGFCLHVLEEHIGIVRCLQLFESRLVTGGDQKKLVVWDTQNGDLVNVVHRHSTLLHLLWTDATRIVTASPDSPGTITVLNYW